MIFRVITYTILSIILCSDVAAEEELFEFDDQSQYEVFYDYTYQINFVEFLTTDCSSSRKVGGKFYLTMTLTDEYKEIILGVENLTDVFSGKALVSLLWGELIRGITRNDTMTSALDPVGYAQFKSHTLVDENKELYELICEEIYWDEVLKLEILSNELLLDTENRVKDKIKLFRFKSASEDEFRNLKSFIGSLKPSTF